MRTDVYGMSVNLIGMLMPEMDLDQLDSGMFKAMREGGARFDDFEAKGLYFFTLATKVYLEWLTGVGTQTPEFVHGVWAILVNVLKPMIDPDPARRPSAAAALETLQQTVIQFASKDATLTPYERATGLDAIVAGSYARITAPVAVVVK